MIIVSKALIISFGGRHDPVIKRMLEPVAPTKQHKKTVYITRSFEITPLYIDIITMNHMESILLMGYIGFIRSA